MASDLQKEVAQIQRGEGNTLCLNKGYAPPEMKQRLQHKVLLGNT